MSDYNVDGADKRARYAGGKREVWQNTLESIRALISETEDELRDHGADTTVTKKNIYKQASPEKRRRIDAILHGTLLPGSAVIGMDNLTELYKLSASGKSCLILMEHYSNFDFPGMIYLLSEQGGVSAKIGESIVPMAAMKLNEENSMISSLTDSYTHISIFPARRVDQLATADHGDPELKKAREINHAALKKMRELKTSGKIILMFPSGTRYKPDNPQTKRVVKAADSFMRRFEYVIFGGIAGNTLLINNPKDMLSDIVCQDVVAYAFGKVHACKQFRREVEDAVEGSPDRRDLGMHVVERIERELEQLHVVAADYRQQHIPKNYKENTKK